jgi:raffinose/stachyose/melibiose transport system substrate-binding protein
MKRITKALAASLSVAMLAGMAACGGSSSSDTAQADGIYFLNNKPEMAQAMKDLAASYTKQTGVPFTVQTAASQTYPQTLKSEMAKNQPPTLFDVLGQVDLNTWKDYAADMTDSEVYKQLKDPAMALKSDDGSQVLAVPVVQETFGIIYRKDILKKYFEMPGASIKSVKGIKNFETLKTVSDEIQKHKDELGVKGAFTSMGFDPSTNWRYHTHLASVPLAYEFEQDHVTKQPATIKGTYLPEFKNIIDLYLKDSTTPTSALSSKTMDDALADITTGDAVFFQNGSWAWPDLVDGGLNADQIGVLPIYAGIPGEENYGMSTGSETFWCVNKKASAKSQKATKDFLKWLITSDEGREAWSHTMGFSAPFKTFTGKYVTDNPIMKAADQYTAAGKKNLPWAFLYDPSQQWKDNLANSILGYAQGTGNWDGVKSSFVDGWAKEVATSKSNS